MERESEGSSSPKRIGPAAKSQARSQPRAFFQRSAAGVGSGARQWPPPHRRSQRRLFLRSSRSLPGSRAGRRDRESRLMPPPERPWNATQLSLTYCIVLSFSRSVNEEWTCFQRKNPREFIVKFNICGFCYFSVPPPR